jgi:diaminopimelate epimerase
MADIPFVKYQAAGNDFIVVSADDIGLPPDSQPVDIGPFGRAPAFARMARTILARHTGVGADGWFLIFPPRGRERPYAAVRIFNADGSEAEMSGNGIRCAAAWLLDVGLGLTRIGIETPAGLKTVEYTGSHRGERFFRVRMGEPELDPKRIPFRARGASTPVVRYRLPTSLGPKEVTVTSMGNPHCSIFVKSFDTLNWRALGREIERHPAFPKRTNVEFVRVVTPRQIEVRFWERGVGETASSGTGSSAAVVAAKLNRRIRSKVRVRTPGGNLEVSWADSNFVLLTGPVRRVAQGSYDYDELNRSEPS